MTLVCFRCGFRDSTGEVVKRAAYLNRACCHEDLYNCGMRRSSLTIQEKFILLEMPDDSPIDLVDRAFAMVRDESIGRTCKTMKEEIRKTMEVIDDNKDNMKEQCYITIMDRLKSMWEMF